MAIKRTSHAVYDTKYHLVWAPKYRRWIVRKDVRRRAAELFREIADDLGFDINEMEVAKDHVHIGIVSNLLFFDEIGLTI